LIGASIWSWRGSLRVYEDLAIPRKQQIVLLSAEHITPPFAGRGNYAEAKLGFRPQKGPDDHKRLREHLQNQGHSGLASDLNKLRGWRNACDYDDQVPQLHQQVNFSIKVADKIIQACR
jgi:hypothetical protein